MNAMLQAAEEELARRKQEGAAQSPLLLEQAEAELARRQSEGKVGVVRSVRDSAMDTVSSFLGAPADFITAAGNVGLELTGQPRIGEEGSFIPPSNFTSDAIKQKMIESGARTDANFEDRTRGGQIAKVGTDVFGLAMSIASAAPRLIRKAGNEITEAAGSTVSRVFNPNVGGNPGGTGSQIVREIQDTAVETPGRFATGELAAATGAAQGGMIAEELDSRNEDLRFAMEAVGSVINPALIVTKYGASAAEGLYRAAKEFINSSGAQKDRAASIVAQIVEETGEDPQQIIRMLRMAEPDGIQVTPGAKTGGTSKAIARLESYVASRRPSAANDLRDANEQSIDTFRQTADRLGNTGDPVAMRVAADLYKRSFDERLDRIMGLTERRASTTAGKVGTDASLDSIGEDAINALKESRKVLSDVEDDLWAQVPDSVNVPTNALKTALKEVKKQIPDKAPRSRLFPAMEAMAGDGKATVSKLKSLRSMVGAEMRDLYQSGDRQAAAQLNKLYDSMTDMMVDLPGYTEANAFSRSINQRFKETFVQNADKYDRSGRPGEFAERMSGRGPRGAQNIREAEEAARFGDTNNPEQLQPDFATQVAQSGENLVRMAASKVLDANGQISPSKLATFRRDYAESLRRYPEIAKDLASAEKAQTRLKNIEAYRASEVQQFNNSAAARVLNTDPTEESVTRAIKDVLGSKNPQQQIKSLVETAGGDREALDGLSSGIYRAMSERAGSLADLSKSFSDMSETLVSGGLLDQQTANKIKGVLKRAGEVEGNLADVAKTKAEDLNPPISPLLDTFVRVLGARIGAQVGGNTAGGSIQSAGIGSALFRDFMEKIPANRAIDLLEEAVQDPVLLEALLTRVKIKNPQEVRRQLNAALFAAGINAQDDSESSSSRSSNGSG